MRYDNVKQNDFMKIPGSRLGYWKWVPKGGDVKNLPYASPKSNGVKIAKQNIDLSKLDLDSHETSWESKVNP